MSKKRNGELIDKENPEWTAIQIAKARPASEVLPKIFGAQVAQEMLKPGGSKSKLIVAGDRASAGYAEIRSVIVELVNSARVAAARSVNALMTASYWEIGRRIVEAEQKGKRRASYGDQLIERLSIDLTQAFGRGFSARNLDQMRQFYATWAIPQTVSAELPRSPLLPSLYRKPQTPSAESNRAQFSSAVMSKLRLDKATSIL